MLTEASAGDTYPRPLDELHYRLNTVRASAQLPLSLLVQAFNLAQSEAREGRNGALSELLHGLAQKGPTRSEVVVLLEAVMALDDKNPYNAAKRKIQLEGDAKLFSAAGSGKKGYKTINISTPACLVAAVGGVHLVKPCANSVSSVTGSSDFLRLLGVNLNIDDECCEDLVKRLKFGFFSIEGRIPRFDAVYGGRFRVPHVLSFGLPAIVNPFQVDSLLYGIAHPNVELAAQVLFSFGYPQAFVFSTTDNGVHFVDEIGAAGKTFVIGYRDGVMGLQECYDTLEMLELPCYQRLDIRPGENALLNTQYALAAILGKGQRAHEDIIAINAGTFLFLAGQVENLKEGFLKAKSIMLSGAVRDLLIALIDATCGDRIKGESMFQSIR